MNVRSALNNDKVCGYLEVKYFSPSGSLEEPYCDKFNKQLPNGAAAMMYCCTYGIAGNCWFEIADR